MKTGIFQYNSRTKSLDFLFVDLIEIGDNAVIIKEGSKYITLKSEYYIHSFVLDGDITVIMMFERCGWLHPLNFSEFVPLQQRFLPSVNFESGENLFADPEVFRLLEEQKKLISNILVAIEMKNNEQPFKELLIEEKEHEEQKEGDQQSKDEQAAESRSSEETLQPEQPIEVINI